jgi:hypothetical protein
MTEWHVDSMRVKGYLANMRRRPHWKYVVTQGRLLRSPSLLEQVSGSLRKVVCHIARNTPAPRLALVAWPLQPTIH